MREALNRHMSGTRLQGERHGRPAAAEPVSQPKIPSATVRAGSPAYPVEAIYAKKRSGKKQ